jgi:transposase-like protein
VDMGQFSVEKHLRTGRPVKELARTHGVSASWLLKLLRRYRLEGGAGLVARSRRPAHSPSRIADLYEDEIVALRKELDDLGVDAGAETIHYHLSQRCRTPRRSRPSIACSRSGASSPPSRVNDRGARTSASAPICPTSGGRPI